MTPIVSPKGEYIFVVEPEGAPGCRFRLSLPLSNEQPHALLLRVGSHDIALPPSCVEGVYEYGAVRVSCDEAGAFVEVGPLRVPVLHLAFLLGEVSFDEVLRELVVVVGSFERRAALFARGPGRTTRGHRAGEAQGPWAGSLETQFGTFPLLNVGVLLGRRTPEAPPARARRAAAEKPGAATVLVVDRDLDSDPRRLLTGGRHARPHRFWDDHPRHLVVQKLGVAG